MGRLTESLSQVGQPNHSPNDATAFLLSQGAFYLASSQFIPNSRSSGADNMNVNMNDVSMKIGQPMDPSKTNNDGELRFPVFMDAPVGQGMGIGCFQNCMRACLPRNPYPTCYDKCHPPCDF